MPGSSRVPGRTPKTHSRTRRDEAAPSGVTEMRLKVLTLALVAAIIALPVPASQLLNGTFSASSAPSAAATEDSSHSQLLQDPFQDDRNSKTAPARHNDADPHK